MHVIKPKIHAPLHVLFYILAFILIAFRIAELVSLACVNFKFEKEANYSLSFASAIFAEDA